MPKSVNDSVEVIVTHKASLMRGSKKYRAYAEEILRQHGITQSKEAVEAFLMGAVDAMIYDVGTALDFTKQKRSSDDWTGYGKRKQILSKVFH